MVNMRKPGRVAWMVLATANACVVSAFGQEADDGTSGGRIELWLGPTGWPAITELVAANGGTFDSVGFALGAAIHVPVVAFENSDLLAGVDAMVAGTDSNIDGLLATPLFRDLYIGMSAKWTFGAARNVALDAGLGIHLADIAQVDTDYRSALEFRSWEASRIGAMLGATWDIGAGRQGKSSGLFVGFKVHFVDFGNIRDEAVLYLPILGPNAGALNGPMYLFQVGYSSL